MRAPTLFYRLSTPVLNRLYYIASEVRILSMVQGRLQEKYIGRWRLGKEKRATNYRALQKYYY